MLGEWFFVTFYRFTVANSVIYLYIYFFLITPLKYADFNIKCIYFRNYWMTKRLNNRDEDQQNCNKVTISPDRLENWDSGLIMAGLKSDALTDVQSRSSLGPV